MAGEYNPDFYNLIDTGSIASANIIAPVIYDLIKPKSVIDVGCGSGWWANKFKEFGCDVLGIDGDYVKTSPLGADFKAINIDVLGSLSAIPMADMAVCLEVAEHLPEKRAESFVAEICQLAPVILWSAAIPRQSGVHHINCQWPSYWQRFFSNHGFVMSGSIRDRFWDDDRIEPWYRQNLMIVTSTPDKYPNLFPDTELDRVHPVIRSWWS